MNELTSRHLDLAASLIGELLEPVAHADDLVVAVADARGALRMVTGASAARRRTESIGFAEGEDWSTAAAGRNAPGLAIVRGRAVSVTGSEHTREDVRPFSCSAAPLFDPDTGVVTGALDVTGGNVAADPHLLGLVRATAAAIEREWRLTGPGDAPTHDGVRLRLLGSTRPYLDVNGVAHRLSARHAELLTLLATHPTGLDTEHLHALAYDEVTPTTTIRAEMLRLRRRLEAVPGAPQLVSRPYRLTEPVAVDALQIHELLARGEPQAALDLYNGSMMTGVRARPVLNLLRATSGALRESVVTDGDAPTLMRFLQLPEAADDLDAWRLALKVLPARSTQRALVVAHLEALGA